MKCVEGRSLGEGTAVPSPQTPSSPGEWSRRLRRAFLEATADVGARARRTVAVHVERPVTLALVTATAVAQARATTVEIPVIRDICGGTAASLRGI
ncbi:MAG: hypothetical protein ACLTXL_11525, partial [Clostridia bacterium]